MSGASGLAHPSIAALLALAGVLVGMAYFAALRRFATLMVTGSGWRGPVALTLARFAGAGLFLYLAARLGAAPLLAALAGFLVARALSLRLERGRG